MKRPRRKSKRILIIAGPNGAGNTTFATEFLPREGACINFANADLIAAAHSPFAPELAAVKSARTMLMQLSEYADRGESFAFETTLSGRTYATLIRQWRSRGYRVKLFFLQLPNPELAIKRVRRRFHGGLANFHRLYKTLVDEWILFDSSSATPIRLDGGRNP